MGCSPCAEKASHIPQTTKFSEGTILTEYAPGMDAAGDLPAGGSFLPSPGATVDDLYSVLQIQQPTDYKTVRYILAAVIIALIIFNR